MNRAIVTSFSEEGYEVYGRRFIESYYAVGNETPLTVYYEGRSVPEIDGPLYLPLNWDMPDKYARNLTATGGRNYRFQALKFARKVFALTQPTCDNWWVWIDADVVHDKPLDERFFAATCPKDAIISYMGRKDWDHSECGFVVYRTAHPTVLCFLDEFRDLYLTGRVFSLPQWHDSFVFDHLRKKYEARGWPFHNISDGIAGLDPWPETILGEYMTHAKGPEAKVETYGATV